MDQIIGTTDNFANDSRELISQMTQGSMGTDSEARNFVHGPLSHQLKLQSTCGVFRLQNYNQHVDCINYTINHAQLMNKCMHVSINLRGKHSQFLPNLHTFYAHNLTYQISKNSNRSIVCEICISENCQMFLCLLLTQNYKIHLISGP